MKDQAQPHANAKTSVREALDKSLSDIIPDDSWDLSIYSDFDFHVYTEQEFKDQHNYKSSKRIIDIAIACFNRTNESTNSSNKFNYTLHNNRFLKHVFLIENKIRISSAKNDKNQLVETYHNFLSSLKNRRLQLNTNTTFIFVTPPDKNKSTQPLIDALAKVNVNKPFQLAHLKWSPELGDSTINEENGHTIQTDSISDIIRDLIRNESAGEIDPLNEYTKHTLKAFVSFIENNFSAKKSIKGQKMVDRNVFPSFDQFEKFASDIGLNSLTELRQVYKFLSFKKEAELGLLKFQHSKTHPISVFLKTRDTNRELGVKVMQLSRYSTRRYTISIMNHSDESDRVRDVESNQDGPHWKYDFPDEGIDVASAKQILNHHLKKIINNN